MSLYLNENYYLKEIIEIEKILETSDIENTKFSIDDTYFALINSSLYLKIDGPFDKITEIIYSEYLKNYSGSVTGIVQGDIKFLNLPKFNLLKIKLQFENGRLEKEEFSLLNILNLEEKTLKPSKKMELILLTDWTYRGDIKDIANPNVNYSEDNQNNDYKNYENPWRNVFGNSDEAETAFWNTD